MNPEGRGLPFSRFNLRQNPFGEPAPEERSRLFVGSLSDLVGTLQAALWPPVTPTPRGKLRRKDRLALQLVGPGGCGKSTFLRALMGRFVRSNFLPWSPEDGWPPVPGPNGWPLLVDDAHMMTRAVRKRVFRHSVLVLASRRDLAVSLRRAGYHVETQCLEGRVDLAVLKEIVHQRLEWSRRRPGPLPRVDERVLGSLLKRHGPDLPAVQSDLYDMYQELEDG